MGIDNLVARSIIEILNRVGRSYRAITLNSIEDSHGTTREFQSAAFCLPNERSEEPFVLLQIKLGGE